MTRKSKQAGGNLPLTHYERTKKFASSKYGTTSKRLAGHSQYQLGDCALSLTRLGDTALCSPSGYLYSHDAILDYLLTKSQELKEQKTAYEKQQEALNAADEGEDDRKRLEAFKESQKVVKKRKTADGRQVGLEDLKRTSYWLADAQPDKVDRRIEKPPDRPPSPISQSPLRRKDLWTVKVVWKDDKMICAVSGKALRASDAIAFWTDKKEPGTVVLKSVYDQLIRETKRDPETSRKINHTRTLQKSGTSFASSGQQVQAQKYAPTIT